MIPLVSIVIPVYNVEKYLKETLESLLSQHLTAFEVILVNDGSTDNSAEIALSFVQKDERFSYVYQDNRGVSAARNEGLQRAKGTFVFFMDADDTLDVNFLQSSVDVAQAGAYDLVVLGENLSHRIPKLTALPTWGQFLRKEFLDQHPDVLFPIGVQPAEDGLFSHQLIAFSPKIGCNKKAIYHYRSHEGQNTKMILKDHWKVLHSIQGWFDILVDFYTRHAMLEEKALHLARFIEHEPFEFRYLKTELDSAQKDYLFKLIHNFCSIYVLPYLQASDQDKLSERFRTFLQVENHQEFDTFYLQYTMRVKKMLKLKLLLAKFIPISSLRRQVRYNLNLKYGI